LVLNTASNAQPATDAKISAWGTYLGTVEYRMTAATLRYAAKQLKRRNVAPLEDGFYALICHSDTAMQLQADSTWQAAYQYTDPENMRNGVAGTYAGVKVQIDNNIVTSAYGSASATIYHSLLLGRGAMGVTELDGGVKTYTTNSGADKADPIDQFITFGWKANMVPVRLNASCGAIIMTCDE
jgi:N4-gp56 family major capsid protein